LSEVVSFRFTNRRHTFLANRLTREVEDGPPCFELASIGSHLSLVFGGSRQPDRAALPPKESIGC
jgi:hypothetical protein